METIYPRQLGVNKKKWKPHPQLMRATLDSRSGRRCAGQVIGSRNCRPAARLGVVRRRPET